MDTGAFDAFYLDNQRALYNTVYRWLWHAQDSEDIVHEAFARVWQAREGIDGDKLRAYLFRTAINLAAKKRRWSDLRRLVSLEHRKAPDLDAETRLLGQEKAHRVMQAIAGLPQKQKSVLLLVRFSGLSYLQVSDVLGIKPGTVASRLHQATKTIREVVDEH